MERGGQIVFDLFIQSIQQMSHPIQWRKVFPLPTATMYNLNFLFFMFIRIDFAVWGQKLGLEINIWIAE